MKPSFWISTICTLLCATLFPTFLLSEGTKQLSPTANDIALLHINDASATANNFAYYGTANTNKGLAFLTKGTGETVYFAFSNEVKGSDASLAAASGFTFRIVNSLGVVVHGPFAIANGAANGNTFSQVINGPNIGGTNPSGYVVTNPIYVFSPSSAGTYYIEFDASTFENNQNNGAYIKHIDVSVANSSNEIQNGRLFSKNWGFRTPCVNSMGCNAADQTFGKSFEGKLYIQTGDNYIESIDFAGSGFRGLSFQLAFNQSGPGMSGNAITDRRSLNASATTNPDFKVFVNDPDPFFYSAPILSQVIGSPSIVNQSPNCSVAPNLCIDVTVGQPGLIEVLLDFNGNDQIYSPGTTDRVLAQRIPVGGPFNICLPWDGKDGAGTNVDLTVEIPLLATYFQGEVHFMMSDVEYNNPGYVVALVHPSSGNFQSDHYWDDTNIDASNDDDANIDGDNNSATNTPGLPPNPPFVNITGIAQPSHIWNRNTSSSTNGYGESNVINTWWFGHASINGPLSLTPCPPPVPDTITVTPACYLCAVTNICPTADDITVDGTTTYSSCSQTPSGMGSLTGPNGSGCYTWQHNINQNDTVFTCVIACTNSVCDTTFVIILPPPPPGCSTFSTVQDICAYVTTFPTSALAIADCDNGGVNNLTECQTGENPFNPVDDCTSSDEANVDICIYVEANPNSSLALADCDNGGVNNLTECLTNEDPFNPADDCISGDEANVDICIYVEANPNSNLALADCDNGGVNNITECLTNEDPFNPADDCISGDEGNVNICLYVQANPNSSLALADCDNGGVNNITECQTNEDPFNPADDCISGDEANVDICIYVESNPNSSLALADCDNGGVNNITECLTNEDLFNPADDCISGDEANVDICIYVESNPNSSLALADCDNGGVNNLIECQTGEDPFNPSDDCISGEEASVNICNYVEANPTSLLALADCDNGGVNNLLECEQDNDPFDPDDECESADTSAFDICLFVTNNPGSDLALADCDGGGVSNLDECNESGDPFDPADDCDAIDTTTFDICDYVINNPNSTLASGDCDGGGITNLDECLSEEDPFDPIDDVNPIEDFNTTYVNVPVTGDVSTNDINVPGGSTYISPPGNPSNPDEFIFPVINPDGTYTFTSPVPGIFTFYVPIVLPSGDTIISVLKINVLDATSPFNQPVANTDIATTLVNTPVTLNTLANDYSGNSGVLLDSSTVEVVLPPTNGSYTINPITGDITYTPNPGFIGNDTLIYIVFDENGNVAKAAQIITILPNGIENTTTAADDYDYTPYNTPTSGNVLINDTDAEGDDQSVVPQNITTPQGTLVLNADGSYTFTPVNGFSGPVEFPYTINDDNPNGSATANATLHILVEPDPCAIPFTDATQICVMIQNNPNHPIADLDCDGGGISNEIECALGGDPLDPDDECESADTTAVDLCDYVINNPGSNLASLDCDEGGVNNLLECEQGGDPFDPVDDCESADTIAFNICDYVINNEGSYLALSDCDGGGVSNLDECNESGDPFDPSDDCESIDTSLFNICDYIESNPISTLAFADCDGGGVPNYIECDEGTDPFDPADECESADNVDFNICTYIAGNPTSGLADADCDSGGVPNDVECEQGGDPFDPADDCESAEAGNYDICVYIADNPGSLLANADCDGGSVPNNVECANGDDPFDPSDDNSTNAVNDINQTPLNTPVSGSVHTNDTDAEGDDFSVSTLYIDTNGDGIADVVAPVGTPVTVAGVDEMGNAVLNAGTLTVNSDGSYTYNPSTGFLGTITTLYVNTDDNVTNPATDTASLVIEVKTNNPGGNDNPVANDDTNTTEQGVPVSSNVLPNDSDPDGDALIVSSVLMDTDGDGLADDAGSVGTTTPVYGTDEDGNIMPAGTLVINQDGSYTYTPNMTFIGTIPAEYSISDGEGGSDDATLTIDVVPNIGNTTFANDDANSGLAGETQTGNVVDNDNDPEGDTQSVSSIINSGGNIANAGNTLNLPSGGTLVVNTNGTYTYNPSPSFVGTEVVRYVINDGNGAIDTATIYLTTFAQPSCIDVINNPFDICEFLDNHPNSPLATADCDNAGVNNELECAQGGNPTDPNDECISADTSAFDICTYVEGNTTSFLATADCDNGGISNLIECLLDNDPFNPSDDCASADESNTDICPYVEANPNSLLAMADCDNGGISNLIECQQDNDPFNPADDCTSADESNTDICLYVEANPNSLLAMADCDNGGISNLIECLQDNDPFNPSDDCASADESNTDICPYVVLNPNSLLALADCDNGGISNLIECQQNNDPFNPADDCASADESNTDICPYVVLNQNSLLALADCDNGGISNLIECQQNNDPFNPADDCASADESNTDICPYVVLNQNSLLALADCDNGGISNLIECQQDNDPFNPSDDCASADESNTDICPYVETNPNSLLAMADCDNGGISNLIECQQDNDPFNPSDDCASADESNTDICPYVEANPNSLLALADCDNGGVPNGIECENNGDPFGPGDDCESADDVDYDLCAYIVLNPASVIATADCDLGGVPNNIECNNGGDPVDPNDDCDNADDANFDICAYIANNTTSSLANADCDGGGVPNIIECSTDNDPFDATDDNSTNAVNDINQTPLNTPISGDVHTNDSDAEGDNFTVTTFFVDTNGDGIVDLPVAVGINTIVAGVDEMGNPVLNAGTIVLNSNGTYTYNPAAGFLGTITTNYVNTDDNIVNPARDTASLVIEVKTNNPGGNDNPIANDDTNTTEIGVPVSSNVLPNDSDPDGDALLVVSLLMDTDGDGNVDDVVLVGVNTPVYGTDINGDIVPAGNLIINGNGTYTFTPNLTFIGTVPSQYTISDGEGGSDNATLTIDIIPNDGNNTFANDDANSGLAGETQLGNVLDNDNDPEGHTQVVTSITNSNGTSALAGNSLTLPSGGSLVVNNDGSYTYNPFSTFEGTEVVTYIINDGNGAVDTATIYLTTFAQPTCADAISNPFDICEFLIAHPNSPLALADCDNAGVNNATECEEGGDPLNPNDECTSADNPNFNICQYVQSNVNSFLATADCDNGGVPNLIECENGGDPFDPTDDCESADDADYNICTYVTANPSSLMATTDCDNGGVPNLIECDNGGDPLDPTDDCESADDADFNICTYVTANPSSLMAAADCDNGGVPNLIECNNGGDPLDPTDDCESADDANFNICNYVLANQGSLLALADCDNGGINNLTECQTGENPFNPADDCTSAQQSNTNICNYVNANPASLLAIADCDNGGVPNGIECGNGGNPFNAADDCNSANRPGFDICTYVQANPTSLLALADCDNGGINNLTECQTGENPFNPADDCTSAQQSNTNICPYVNANPTSLLAIADCDNGGVPNGVECGNGGNPFNAADDCNSANRPGFNICTYVQANPISLLALADCDNGGINNLTECQTGENPFNPADDCTSAQQSNTNICPYVNANPTSLLAIADCDNGGVPNGIECGNGGNPFNPSDDCNSANRPGFSICTYVQANPTSLLALADCDNGGINNLTECQTGENPFNPADDCTSAQQSNTNICPYVLSNPTSLLALADCDNGGVPNGIECGNNGNPFNASDDCNSANRPGFSICTYAQANPTSLLALADCDNGGINNLTECQTGENPFNPADDCTSAQQSNTNICTYVNANPTSLLAIADCDNGGVPNGIECGNNGNPFNAADDCNSANRPGFNICTYVQANPTSLLALADCDNGGINNLTECQTGENPFNPADDCTSAQQSNTNICAYVTANPTSLLAIADCDNGGVPNGIECGNNGNPFNAADDCNSANRPGFNICIYVQANPTSLLALADCDNGGINNLTECQTGENPFNPADDCTSAQQSGINICTFVLANPTSSLALADCDNGGVNNVTECTDGTNVFDPADDLTIIGNFIWEDLDGDGTQDSGEPGLAGYTVNLFNSSNVLIGSAITDGSGNYTITARPGQYYLKIYPPTEYLFSAPNQGSDNTDSEVDGSNGFGTTPLIAFTGGTPNNSMDIGIYRCIKLGEQVFYDVDKDDIWDTNENGVNGLPVKLYRRVNNVWTLYQTINTGHKPGTQSDDGYWTFCVPPGTYYIHFNIPPIGLVPVRKDKLGVIALTNPNEQGNDSDIDFSGKTDQFTVVSGQNIINIGAGFYPMATAGNLVWEDSNNNGIQEQSEPKSAGVLVEAFNVSNQKIGEDVTDFSGTYKIEYLGKDDYYLKFTPPSGYGFTMSHEGQDAMDSDVDHTNGLNTTQLISMEPGVNYINIDAGLAFGVLPVTWLGIDAKYVDTHVEVSWKTAIELNTEVFEVERLNKDGSFSKIGSVKAAGNSTSQRSYIFNDEEVNQGNTYEYRIKQIDFDGRFTYSDIAKVYIAIDKNDVILYPVPASEATILKFTLKEESDVKVYMLDIKSAEVLSTILNQKLTEGLHNIRINLTDVASGVYTILVSINGLETKKRLIVIE